MTGLHLTNDQLDPIWQSVPLGTPVYTIGGNQLGAVTEKRTHGLIVEGGGANGETYVVTPQDIARIEKGSVHLLIGADQAMRAQASAPGEEKQPQPPGAPS